MLQIWSDFVLNSNLNTLSTQDFVHYYVPGSNHTKCPYAPGSFHGPRCPGNSIPCCLPLTMERWQEALTFAHRNGMQVVFNLNLLHGRFDDYSNPKKLPGRVIPHWDSSEARALMEWTAQNVKQELWPAAFGLGNELNGYLSAETWAADEVTMYNLIQETFGKHGKLAHPEAKKLKGLFSGSGSNDAESGDASSGDGGDALASVPSTYGPCNGVGATWSTTYLNNITALSKNALGAFSFHTYDHGGAEVSEVADMVGGIGRSRAAFASAAAIHSAANTNSKLWITETAWSASAPAGSSGGGAKASIDGMCRAADIAWNLDALGAAAEVGVDVFCRETLAGDWLETIGLWQPGDARTGEHNRPYTPHPDFWIAALWNKLMGVKVLGANATNTTTHYTVADVAPTPIALAFASGKSHSEQTADDWLIAKGFSCNFGDPVNGTETIPFFGRVQSSTECQAKCEASAKTCYAWSWCGPGCGGEWADTCYGRLDKTWTLNSVPAAVSGCDKSKAPCVPPPPPPPPPLAVTTYAHCSKVKQGAVVFAISASPCVRSESIDLRFPGATKLTTWWLSALSPSDDMISLNGQNLTVSVAAPLPSLDGSASSDTSVTVPSTGVCTVGFVQVEYSSPVPACQ